MRTIAAVHPTHGFLAKDGLKNNKTITGIPINNNGLRDKPSRNSPCKNK